MEITKDDKMLMAAAEDKFHQAAQQYRTIYTNFLDLHQRSLIEKQWADMGRGSQEIRCVFWGGYEDAERKVLFFLPDYLQEVPTDEITVVKADFAKGVKLAHKDFLGSALGLGIKRENTGDILICESFAQIFILPILADFFLTNYTNAGRQNISCSIISTDEITLPLQQTELKTVTLASLRGDCIVSALFSISRSKASELIEKGRVFVNDVPFLKPDRPLNSGDKVKVTKSGRAYIEEIGGTSRKGRIFVTFKVYK